MVNNDFWEEEAEKGSKIEGNYVAMIGSRQFKIFC